MKARLKTVIGWWDWDAETPALVNRVTGERVAFRGRLENHYLVSPDEAWLRFDYLHPELNFPLLVEERAAEDPEDKGKAVWRLDYCRSSELWNRESEGKSLHPSFGAWRRVDDCVTDAFACWPDDNAAQEAFSSDFSLVGGWLNGTWRDDLQRLVRRAYSKERVQSERVSPEYDYDSWLMPLDETPPSAFRFHDHIPRRNGTENWDMGNPVLLTGLSFEHQKMMLRPTLPPGKALTGLKGRAPYLMSTDESRLLYPYYGDTEADRERGHWSPSNYLLYADDIAAVGATLKSKNRDQKNFASDWHVILSGTHFGIRQSYPESPFFLRAHPEVPPETKMLIPSRALWLRARWGIIDGWGLWPGSRAHNPTWCHGLDLYRTKSVLASSGYRGGQWSVATRIIAASSSDGIRRGGLR